MREKNRGKIGIFILTKKQCSLEFYLCIGGETKVRGNCFPLSSTARAFFSFKTSEFINADPIGELRTGEKLPDRTLPTIL
jgi:hypothetical protein